VLAPSADPADATALRQLTGLLNSQQRDDVAVALPVGRVTREDELPAPGRIGGAGMLDRSAARRHLAGPADRIDEVAEGHGPLAGVAVFLGVLVGVTQAVRGIAASRWPTG
jgi:hypothetical protein